MPPARVEHDRARVERPRKVLYIEDNPVNVLLMEAMLARVADLQVRAAALPTLGLRLAIEERPDLILLDIQLPEMDGYEVLRRLRLHDASRDIPVIAVSANAMPGDIAHGLAAGFVEYLTKPLDMQKLIAAVEHALASG
jgi:CheY-like chemotaxis protein